MWLMKYKIEQKNSTENLYSFEGVHHCSHQLCHYYSMALMHPCNMDDLSNLWRLKKEKEKKKEYYVAVQVTLSTFPSLSI